MFIRKWWTASIEAGNNVRGTQLGSLKSGLSCQIHTRNPERKRSALCCMVYRSVWDLIHFYEFYDLVLLKNIKYFFINLEQFQAMPWVWSRLNLRPLAYSEISRFSTLHQRDALSQLSNNDLKNYHWNLPGAFGVCFQMPSNS